MSVDVLPSCSTATSPSASLYERSSEPKPTIAAKPRSASKSANSSRYETTIVKNTVALAVISKLHKWCVQLFWLTIVCVIGWHGELNTNKRKTLQDVRRNIIFSNSNSRRSLTDLEMQLLRHLTSSTPQTTLHRPLRRPSSSHKKRPHSPISRMPSPPLATIYEEPLE